MQRAEDVIGWPTDDSDALEPDGDEAKAEMTAGASLPPTPPQPAALVQQLVQIAAQLAQAMPPTEDLTPLSLAPDGVGMHGNG